MVCTTNRSCYAACLIAAILVFMLAIPAQASDTKEQPSDWEFNLAPFYLWAVSITGDQSVGSASGPIDVSFSDVSSGLDAAFIFHFEGTYQNEWGFLIDVNYIGLSLDGTTDRGIKQDVDLDLILAELGGYYRLSQDAHNFDFLLGGRFYGADTEIKLSGGPLSGLTVEGDKSWIDPFLGARWVWRFHEQVGLIARADIGGFGVGSDIAANGAILLNWQPFKYVGFILGYRALYVDYSDGDGRDAFGLDATIHGPIIGINFRW